MKNQTLPVLIVDDAPNWLAHLAAFYQQLGYEVQKAASYGEACGLLRRDKFCLAIIDLQLNGNNLDGIFLLDVLSSKRIPVMIVTAWSLPRVIDAIFQSYDVVFQILDKANFEEGKLEEYTRQALETPVGEQPRPLPEPGMFRQLIQEVLTSLGDSEKSRLNEVAQCTERQAMPDKDKPGVDFVIVTALEVEAEALLRKIKGCHIDQPQNGDIFTYHHGKVKIRGQKKSYSVVVVQLNKMGTVAAAIASTCAISYWNPQFIMMVGIAGGFPQEDLDLGDVVVADQIIGHDYAKIEDKRIQRRYQVYPASQYLLVRIHGFHADQWCSKVTARRPADGRRTFPKRFIGPVASGNKVIASKQFRSLLLKDFPKLIAVEMEAEGVLQAAHAHSHIIPALVVRGISDMADERKSDEWHEYAADAAATFVVQFLRSGPVEPVRQQLS